MPPGPRGARGKTVAKNKGLSFYKRKKKISSAHVREVFSWLFGAPLMLVPMVMLSLFCTYELTFAQCFKNAIVIIVNSPVMVAVMGVASAVPFIIMGVGGMIVGIIVYIVMIAVGCNIYAQMFVAMAHRGMTKCHARKEVSDRENLQLQRQLAKKNGRSDYYGAGGGFAQKKQKQQPKPYQNPKKKKKKN